MITVLFQIITATTKVGDWDLLPLRAFCHPTTYPQYGKTLGELGPRDKSEFTKVQ